MKYKTLLHKDDLFPKQLDYIHKPPSQLWVAGTLPGGKTLGVIGSRRPSAYGVWATQKLVRAVAAHDITIISGLAIGIDSIAHKAALANKAKTVAVLPSGIENIYPSRHQSLANQIIAQDGALISEYSPEAQARKDTFIARNRIIAALSDVLLVVEASHKSGTMHTVRFALEQGKEVAAVPGPINSVLSEGSNQMLHDGAHVINSEEALLDLFNIAKETVPIQRIATTPLEKKIMQELQSEPMHPNALLRLLDVPLSDLNQVMTRLEINNLVAKTTEGLYALR